MHSGKVRVNMFIIICKKYVQQFLIILQSLYLKDFAMKLRFSSHKSKIMNDMHKKILLDTDWNNNLYAIMCYNLYQFVLQTLFWTN